MQERFFQVSEVRLLGSEFRSEPPVFRAAEKAVRKKVIVRHCLVSAK